MNHNKPIFRKHYKSILRAPCGSIKKRWHQHQPCQQHLWSTAWTKDVGLGSAEQREDNQTWKLKHDLFFSFILDHFENRVQQDCSLRLCSCVKILGLPCKFKTNHCRFSFPSFHLHVSVRVLFCAVVAGQQLACASVAGQQLACAAVAGQHAVRTGAG